MLKTLVKSDLQIGMAKTRLTSWLSLNKAVFKKAAWFAVLQGVK